MTIPSSDGSELCAQPKEELAKTLSPTSTVRAALIRDTMRFIRNSILRNEGQFLYPIGKTRLDRLFETSDNDCAEGINCREPAEWLGSAHKHPQRLITGHRSQCHLALGHFAECLDGGSRELLEFLLPGRRLFIRFHFVEHSGRVNGG